MNVQLEAVKTCNVESNKIFEGSPKTAEKNINNNEHVSSTTSFAKIVSKNVQSLDNKLDFVQPELDVNGAKIVILRRNWSRKVVGNGTILFVATLLELNCLLLKLDTM